MHKCANTVDRENMQHNEYLVANIGFGIAEKESCEVCHSPRTDPTAKPDAQDRAAGAASVVLPKNAAAHGRPQALLSEMSKTLRLWC